MTRVDLLTTCLLAFACGRGHDPSPGIDATYCAELHLETGVDCTAQDVDETGTLLGQQSSRGSQTDASAGLAPPSTLENLDGLGVGHR